MYWRLALVVSMAAAVIVAALTAGIVALASRTALVSRATETLPPAKRAWAYFFLRLAPALAGIIAGFAVVLPTFLYFEPRDTQESIAWTLVVIAALGAIGVLRSVWRVTSLWRATRALDAEWRARGHRIETRLAPLPVFAVDDRFPLVAVLGFTRPAVFIADRVLRSCTQGEIEAMLLHERSHVVAHDNVKRLLLRAAPAFVRPVARFERAWAEAAEEAADDRAAAGRPDVRLNLAQALISIARLVNGDMAASPLATAFYLGGSIDGRVRSLLARSDRREAHPSFRVLAALAAGAALAALGAFIATAPAVHQLMEAAVRWLP